MKPIVKTKSLFWGLVTEEHHKTISRYTTIEVKLTKVLGLVVRETLDTRPTTIFDRLEAQFRKEGIDINLAETANDLKKACAVTIADTDNIIVALIQEYPGMLAGQVEKYQKIATSLLQMGWTRQRVYDTMAQTLEIQQERAVL